MKKLSINSGLLRVIALKLREKKRKKEKLYKKLKAIS